MAERAGGEAERCRRGGGERGRPQHGAAPPGPAPDPGGSRSSAEAVWDSAPHTTGTEATRGAPPTVCGLAVLPVT